MSGVLRECGQQYSLLPLLKTTDRLAFFFIFSRILIPPLVDKPPNKSAADSEDPCNY